MRIFDEVLDVTMKVTKLEKAEILSKTRIHQIVQARMIIAVILRQYFNVPMMEVAKALRKDRTSIINMIKVHRNYKSSEYMPYVTKYDEALRILSAIHPNMIDEFDLENIRKNDILSVKWRGNIGIVAVGSSLLWVAFIGCATHGDHVIDANKIKESGYKLPAKEGHAFFLSLNIRNYLK